MKVLLLDDHPLILDGLAGALARLDSEIETRLAVQPDEAYALLDAEPDVNLVLLDLKLGDGVDGFEVLRELRQNHPQVPVVVVSGTERLADVVRVVDMGSMGFVPKRSTREEMQVALAMVVTGGVYIPAALLELITRMQGRGELGDTTISAARAQLAAADAAEAAGAALPAAGASAFAPAAFQGGATAAAAWPGQPGPGPGLTGLGLTPRQTEVLHLLLKALPNKLIARELNLSVETVKDHVAAVLRALGVNSRTQAVLAVSRLNQLPPVGPRF